MSKAVQCDEHFLPFREILRMSVKCDPREECHVEMLSREKSFWGKPVVFQCVVEAWKGKSKEFCIESMSEGLKNS